MNLHLLNHGGEMFTEIIAAVQRSATQLGHSATHSASPRSSWINVYFVGHPGFIREFHPPRKSVNVLYNFEQSLPPGYEKFDAILSIFTHIQGPKIIAAPAGYAPTFETDLPAQEETIDVLHLGPLTESRKGEVGARYGHLIPAPSAFGRERDGLLLQAQINLIVKSLPVYHFPVLRFLLFACKRRFVLTEAHDSYSTVDPKRHLTLSSGDLERDIRHWLAAGNEARQEIADRVYEDLRAHCNYTTFLGPALDALKRRFRA